MNNSVRRVFRYVFMFLLVLIITAVLTYGKLELLDWIVLALLITACFLFIDLYYPIVTY